MAGRNFLRKYRIFPNSGLQRLSVTLNVFSGFRKPNCMGLFSIYSVTFVKKNIIMRLVTEVPHSRYKIQIFNYNSKFIVKIELDQFEQVYKIGETDVNGVEEVVKMVNESLLKNSLTRFIEMRSDWGNAFKEINN